ncbi:MAG: 16S rRNA (guanine(966)-N(2))-methyltransferase RsmD [Chloroflexi bacterium]|nr:MAG: 16S rRNA (guanine(966)-N(2))-methyltransferase RsmD [Chloroflexota bacterium]
MHRPAGAEPASGHELGGAADRRAVGGRAPWRRHAAVPGRSAGAGHALARPPATRPGLTLRVTGGEVRGRRLLAPRGIRPSEGLVREAIFNMVASVVADAAVLDLFAGSGALGIEALSRGAAQAVFVDRSEQAFATVKRNLESAGLGDRGRVFRADAARWLGAHPAEVGAATLALLDPPYADTAALAAALHELDARLASAATVVVEHDARHRLPELSRLAPDRTRRYGGSSVTILRIP